ncbi:hypothetical protein MK079_02230 [Candidatus Gracilibacteria bacterium]|nr:hypothetical protein [Candidatus Gracilibacteria bacterium]
MNLPEIHINEDVMQLEYSSNSICKTSDDIFSALQDENFITPILQVCDIFNSFEKADLLPDITIELLQKAYSDKSKLSTEEIRCIGVFVRFFKKNYTISYSMPGINSEIDFESKGYTTLNRAIYDYVEKILSKKKTSQEEKSKKQGSKKVSKDTQAIPVINKASIAEISDSVQSGFETTSDTQKKPTIPSKFQKDITCLHEFSFQDWKVFLTDFFKEYKNTQRKTFSFHPSQDVFYKTIENIVVAMGISTEPAKYTAIQDIKKFFISQGKQKIPDLLMVLMLKKMGNNSSMYKKYIEPRK